MRVSIDKVESKEFEEEIKNNLALYMASQVPERFFNPFRFIYWVVKEFICEAIFKLILVDLATTTFAFCMSEKHLLDSNLYMKYTRILLLVVAIYILIKIIVAYIKYKKSNVYICEYWKIHYFDLDRVVRAKQKSLEDEDFISIIGRGYRDKPKKIIVRLIVSLIISVIVAAFLIVSEFSDFITILCGALIALLFYYINDSKYIKSRKKSPDDGCYMCHQINSSMDVECQVEEVFYKDISWEETDSTEYSNGYSTRYDSEGRKYYLEKITEDQTRYRICYPNIRHKRYKVTHKCKFCNYEYSYTKEKQDECLRGKEYTTDYISSSSRQYKRDVRY